MAVSESFKEYVLDQLGKLGFVTVKREEIISRSLRGEKQKRKKSNITALIDAQNMSA
ncbi:hypothetical protein [Desulfosporosinus sp. FKB]|uniref:hypothetical protein n=1 Tax=Desulfosporosinus sp. FKB TaxID=1969835 RepID=UPI001A9A5FD8|nr:hypothetical protein [Desulfosporosinus sp. FKB]